MKRKLNAKERELQIELVRSRAAIERQDVVRSVNMLALELRPRAVFKSFFPGLSSSKPSDFLLKAFSLTRRYPLLASSASALLTRGSKRKGLWRIGAGLLLSWQIARAMKK
ncbi:MAG TPA: hypothetical protein VL001_09120 [Candidimonas sp.]|nr:hypothetical protein [Candidimonas sp.]